MEGRIFAGMEKISSEITKVIREAVEQGEMPALFEAFNALLGQFPSYYSFLRESDFQRALFTFLLVSGVDVRAEVDAGLGRADLIVYAQKYCYILELKLGKSPLEGLAQIVEKEYVRGVESEGREILCVGVSISKAQRRIRAYALKSAQR